MTLAKSITSAPGIFDQLHADEVAEIFCDQPKQLAGLLAAMASCSPYLRGLIHREQDWLKEVGAQDPAVVFDGILGGADPANLATSLRRAKGKMALLTAICDLGGIWELAEVTGQLTRFADFSVDLAFRHFLHAEQAKGNLPENPDPDEQDFFGLVVLAMGKMGAAELNYSSDIDLIVLFDDQKLEDDQFAEVRAALLRVTKRATRLLADVTSDGYVFRTDLRLRPDPAVTPVCVAMSAAERYYESLGRTWERAAFIKARPCAGDLAAGRDFLERLRPFVWRKHLDFAAIQDAHDMRLRIREHKGLGGAISVPGHNLKLGRGGIREIEFFTQTRQLIAGGRDPDLRQKETLASLASLVAKGWVEKDASVILGREYAFLRTLEHRIQMINDAQTHDMPTGTEQISRLAAFCGWQDQEAFLTDIHDRLQAVHEVIESFFVKDQPAHSEAGSMPDIAAEDAEVIADWHKLPALRSERSKVIFSRLKPRLFKRLKDALDPQDGLRQLDRFFRGLPSGVQLLSLFEANPQILDLLVDICATAPRLAVYLSDRPQVLDAVLSGDFFNPIPDQAVLAKDLAKRLDGEADYERSLDSIRRWRNEMQFRLGVSQLTKYADSQEAAKGYSALAETCVKAVFPLVEKEFSRRFGRVADGSACVLAMGKLGSGEMTATSDLDLIVIYDAVAGSHSDGKKQLDAKVYFSRFTQSLITALSSPMAEGRLYEVDMRLRPSGRQGPVATSLAGFENYQMSEAWTWEHLALTRGKVIAGSVELAEKTEETRHRVLSAKSDPAIVWPDVADMRQRLAESKFSNRPVWDVKNNRGGLLDLELLAQALALISHCEDQRPVHQIRHAAEQGMITEEEQNTLISSHQLFVAIQQVSRLLAGESFDPEALGQGARALLVEVAGAESVEELENSLKTAMAQSAEIADKKIA